MAAELCTLSFLSAPQLCLPQETCRVLPVWRSLGPVQKILKMSRVLRAPLNVTVATFISVEVSTEGQVPKMCWGPGFTGPEV